MTLSSSLGAGVAGLQVNASRLATISDNIANASTTGYKRADVEFESLIVPSTANSYTAGGVRSNSIRDVATPGTLTATTSALDLAISGNGFLPVTETIAASEGIANPPFLLTTTGAFSRDAEGLLTTRTGLALTGWRTNPDGSLPTTVVRTGPDDLEPVRIVPFLNEPVRTTDVDLVVNLPSFDTGAGSDGTPYTIQLNYFDPLGASEQLTATFTPTIPATGSSNTWDLVVTDSASTTGTPIGEFELIFDPNDPTAGEIQTLNITGAGAFNAATGELTVATASGNIDIFIGGLAGGPVQRPGITQVAGDFIAISADANGSGAGALSRLELDDAGFLRGIYDNGANIALYQIPVVDVPNQDGLELGMAQTFQLTTASGNAALYDAGTASVGTIEGFSLQESNVDIALELTQLIQTQRSYSSNATVIRTVDEMLQETTNLKR
ncbi:MAG: flagellar hook-basal body complex protein [Pseudomonadota bacterium]